MVDYNDSNKKEQIIEEIAIECSVDKRSVYRWISGKNSPHISVYVKLLAVLKKYKPDVKLEDLVNSEEPAIS